MIKSQCFISLFLAFLVYGYGHSYSFAQTADSFSVSIPRSAFLSGDTIELDARLDNYTKSSRASTIHLWIEDLKTGKKWHYRYPLINGTFSANLFVDPSIRDGNYAFTFQCQKTFFNLSGLVKNAEPSDRLLNFAFISKSMETYADAVPLNEDKSFSIGRLLFQDSAFIVFSKPKQTRNNLIVQLSNPIDSPFTPIATITKFISVGKNKDSLMNKMPDVKNYVFSQNNSLYTSILPEVVVQAKSKKSIETFEKENVSGFFAGDDAMVLDGLESNEIANTPNLLTYLTSKVGGLSQETNEDGTQQLKWRNHRTEIYINEIKADADFALDINTADIAMIKIFQPGFMMSTSNSAGGAIAIYTKMGSYKKSNNTNYSFYIVGYSGLESTWKE